MASVMNDVRSAIVAAKLEGYKCWTSWIKSEENCWYYACGNLRCKGKLGIYIRGNHYIVFCEHHAVNESRWTFYG